MDRGGAIFRGLLLRQRAGVSAATLGVMALLALGGCTRAAPSGGPLDVSHVLGESGAAPGQFGYPRCIDQDGQWLWVIDKLARVQRIDPLTGHAVEVWRTPKYDNGKPTGVSLWVPKDDPTREGVRLFVADTHEHRILVYRVRPAPVATTDDGALLEQAPELEAIFGSYGTNLGQFIYPTDVCIVPTRDGRSIERLFVSEYGDNDRVSMWEPAGSGSGAMSFTCVGSFGTFGTSRDAAQVQFSRPQSMALATRPDGTRHLLVADACNHRVGVFTLDGALVRWLGSPAGAGTQPGAFQYPYSVVDLGDGTVMVGEFGANRLQRVDWSSGASLGIFGQRGRGQGQLATPWGMTLLGDMLYVLDSGNSRIVAIDKPTGRPAPLAAHTPQLASSDAGRDAARGAGGAR